MILTMLYYLFKQRKYTFWSLLFIVWGVLLYFSLQINTNEDISQIFNNNKNVFNYHELSQKTNILDKIIIRVSFNDTAKAQPQQLIETSDEFVSLLIKDIDCMSLISDFRHKISNQEMTNMVDNLYKYLPYYLNQSDYDTIENKLNSSNIHRELKSNYQLLTSPVSFSIKKHLAKDPLHFFSIGLEKLKKLKFNDDYVIYDGYIMDRKHNSILMMLSTKFPSSDTKKNSVLVESLNEKINQINSNHKDTHVEYFGSAAVAVANARQIQSDITLTATISILTIFLLMWWYYKSLYIPLIIMLPIGFGISFSLAIIYLLNYTISTIALGSGVVIIGIAIDYSLHFITHYRHTQSIDSVLKDLAKPMLIGNISTIAAFLSLCFVDSKILNDFGLFCSFSLVGTILFVLIFLPHCIPKNHFTLRKISWKDSIFSKCCFLNFFTFKKQHLLIVLILSALFYLFASKTHFEENLNTLNFYTPELLKAEQNLNSSSDFGIDRTVYLFTEAKTLDKSLEKTEKEIVNINQLINKNIVNQSIAVLEVLPTKKEIEQRRKKWKDFWTEQKIHKLDKEFQSIAPIYGFKENSFANFFDWLSQNIDSVTQEELFEVQKSSLSQFVSQNSLGNYLVMTGIKFPSSNSEIINKNFENNNNAFLLDKQRIIRNFIASIKKDFNQILLTSSLLVFIILLIYYGRIELAIITFFPMILSWIWIIGIMGVLDIRFNIVNIIISTFIFGLGDDFSIFISDGLLRAHKDGTQNLSSYKTSIILASLTTLIGIGVLIFAQHPALKSIAFISIIGIFSVLFFSYIFIPVLFRWLISDRVNKGLYPFTLFNFIYSFLAFIWFFIGCIFLIIIGTLVFIIFRQKNFYFQNLFRYLLMWFCRSIVWGVYIIKKDYENPNHETLEKPALIIANHQSFIDILVLLASNHKILLFTNSWVWNSPIIGPIVKMAGYFCVDNGVEYNLELIKKEINNGTSIVIFPEGERSEDLSIKRFHKGAFLLAEKLDLDLLPVLIHGTGLCMPKYDYLLQSGKITIKILPRITFNSLDFGTTYQERSKSIRHYFTSEYKIVESQSLDLKYYSKKVSSYFLYKTPQLEWYTKLKLKLEKNYEEIYQLVPNSGRIYDIGCGYGYLSFLIAHMNHHRQVIGIDYDLDKIKVAQNIPSKLPHLQFYSSDALLYPYEDASAIILSDVLHYLNLEDQKKLITQCLKGLSKNGVLIIRDADSSLKNRHLGTVVSEFFSIKLLKFNKLNSKSVHFFSSLELRNYFDDKLYQIKIFDNTKYNSNLIYYINRKVDDSN